MKTKYLFVILVFFLLLLFACSKGKEQTAQPPQPTTKEITKQPAEELKTTIQQITTSTIGAKEDINRLEEISKSKNEPALSELTTKIKTLYSQNTITVLLEEISKNLEKDHRTVGEASIKLSVELLLMDQLIDELTDYAKQTNDAELLDIANDLAIQFDKIRDKFLEDFFSNLEEDLDLDLDDLDDDGVPSDEDPDETSEDKVKEEIEEKFDTELVEQRLRIRAETNNQTTTVKIELRFDSSLVNLDEIINQTIEKLTLNESQVDALLRLQQDDDQEIEEERTRFEAKVKRGQSEVRFELRFNTNQTNRTQIIQEILSRLPPTQDQLNSVLRFEDKDKGVKIRRDKDGDEEDEDKEKTEIEVKIRQDKGFTEVKVEIENKDGKLKDEFDLNTTNVDEVVSEISKRTNLTQEQIRSVMELEIKGSGDDDEEDENNDNGGEKESDDEDENETEIEAEIDLEKNRTKVEVEINNKEDKFTLNTINKEEIISQIAQKYNLTTGQVSDIIEFEEEDEDEEEEA